ncbi:acyl-CoA dehydrogenase family protein [Sphingomonas aurantiaca]|uniref:acyl-CoA dehydrogenase family protein n=1 Tax=Sphingomonas aurantiaca TaxID=185949 RepID=UPI002FE3FA04
MDFKDSDDEATYRATARRWLDANIAEHEAGHYPDDMAKAKAWQARKAKGGYACITWPREWGGGGGTPIESVIFGQEEARHAVDGGYFTIGLGMCVPTVMAYADDATKTRFVGPAVRGDEIWSQLFSEPAGGSDVAAIRTRAVRDGDDWVVNGQGVDLGRALQRLRDRPRTHQPRRAQASGPDDVLARPEGPGIEIRPIHQMSGGSNFNEVWFTDVRIPDTQRLGPIDGGWKVALFTLMNERLAIGTGAASAPRTS